MFNNSSHSMTPKSNRAKRFARMLLVPLACAATLGGAHAHRGNTSELSTLSALPIALSVAMPAMLLSSGAALAVVAVEASAEGTVVILESASDGARASVRLGRDAAGHLSLAAGTVVTCTAVSAGWVLSTAGKAIAFIPNELGMALLHNQRVTP